MMHPTDFDPPLPHHENDGDQGDLLGLFVSLLERWRWLVGATVLGVLASGGLVALTRGSTATAIFVVEQQAASLSQFGGIANQLGIDVPGGLDGDPLGLFEALFYTDDLLLELAYANYSFTESKGGESLSGSGLDLLEIEGDTDDELRREAVDYFRDHLQARVLFDANAVEVSATTPWPGLSEAVVAKALVLANEYNVQRRRRTSAAEREFVEANAEEAQQRLSEAEAELEAFVATNRRYQQSPQLALQFSRLQRIVDRQQQLASSLLQALEQARIAEVRNTPVISVVDRPEHSARPSASIGLAALAGGGLGFALALFGCALADYMTRQRRLQGASYRRYRAIMGAGTEETEPESVLT
ncbi:MAG: hypothetical protein HKO53_05990 [Gemmatimonadetes bacterium]|nr:hypothetical protein [Gemmatimonadota bacterium]